MTRKKRISVLLGLAIVTAGVVAAWAATRGAPPLRASEPAAPAPPAAVSGSAAEAVAAGIGKEGFSLAPDAAEQLQSSASRSRWTTARP